MLMRNAHRLMAAAVVAAISVPVAAQQPDNAGNSAQTEDNQRPAAQQTEPGTTVQERQKSNRQTTPNLERRRQRADSPRARNRGARHAQLDDQALASWVLASTEAELKISQLVAQKAQNEKVKAFAQKMIKEHSALADKLRPIASGAKGAAGQNRGQRRPTAVRDPVSDPAAQSQTRSTQPSADPATNRTDPTQPSARPGTRPNRAIGRRHQAGGESQNPAVALHQKIAQKYAQSTVQAMQQAAAGELGPWYLGQTVIAHMNTKAALETVTPMASPQLRPVLEDASQTINQHMQEALQLMGEIGQSQQQPQQ